MFSHICLGAKDMAAMAAFYDAVLAPLGITRCFTDPAGIVVGWRGPPDGPALYVGLPFDGQPATTANGGMTAFRAPNQEAVDQTYQTALAQGGTAEGEPGLRPQYKPNYYGAYFRDPEGNKLHVVHLG